MKFNIRWGTYLFFVTINVCVLPIFYLLYPEIARRILEEIDNIFAKGCVEESSYVRVMKGLKYLEDEGSDEMATKYVLVEEVEHGDTGLEVGQEKGPASGSESAKASGGGCGGASLNVIEAKEIHNRKSNREVDLSCLILVFPSA